MNKNKKGTALLIVILILGMLSLAIFGIYTSVIREMRMTNMFLDSKKALYLAEGGLERGYLYLANNKYSLEEDNVNNLINSSYVGDQLLNPLFDSGDLKLDFIMNNKVVKISNSLGAQSADYIYLGNNNGLDELRIEGDNYKWSLYGEPSIGGNTEVLTDGLKSGNNTFNSTTTGSTMQMVAGNVLNFYKSGLSFDFINENDETETADYINSAGMNIGTFLSSHKNNYLLIYNYDIEKKLDYTLLTNDSFINPRPSLKASVTLNEHKEILKSTFVSGKRMPLLDFTVYARN